MLLVLTYNNQLHDVHRDFLKFKALEKLYGFVTFKITHLPIKIKCRVYTMKKGECEYGKRSIT